MEFDRAYTDAMQHVKIVDRNLYEIGIRTFDNAKKQQKEEILLKLLTLYPNDSELYYKMATLFTGDLRSFVWHKMCFTIDPCHKENIIHAIQMFYHKGLFVRVFDYVSTPIFSDLIEDPRFLSVYSRCNFQQLCYKNGVSYLLKLIEYYSTKSATTMDEKVAKWSNYHDLGYVYCVMGEIEMSLKYTKKAVDLADKFGLELWRRLLSFSNSLCYADFKYNDKVSVFQEYLKINDYLPAKTVFSHRRRKSKIRVGYVSSDFMYHAVANFIIPILENHNRSRFEVILYANQAEFSTDIFVNLGLSHRMIKDRSDEEIAQVIYNDHIDILIDLNGHTVGNRLGVFRFRPSPIQITYLGYPNTTGMKTIQYRITDTIADVDNTCQPYTESLIRLPRCFLLYKPFHQKIPVKTKHEENAIILGAINKENKNTSYTLDTWASILSECPNTQLLIKLETFDNIEERLAFYVEKLRTSANRIIIVPKLGNIEYNTVFSRIDLLLDPFPYSGTTTTCNALFNSIPVVTLYHKNCHAHNVSASILSNTGLGELVAYSREQYISIVKTLVSDPRKISEYKRTIHNKFRETIMDPVPFMRSYESALIDTMK